MHQSAPKGSAAKSNMRSRAKARKPNLSYCQRLIRDIDRAESASRQAHNANPQLPREESKCQTGTPSALPTSSILDLPSEIQQSILCNILDDNETLSHQHVHEITRNLSSVCRAFQADMRHVSKRWIRRQQELKQSKMAFDGYIADLMAPISAAAKVTWKRKGRLARERRRMETKAGLRDPQDGGDIRNDHCVKRSLGDLSDVEKKDAENWRNLREARLKELKGVVNGMEKLVEAYEGA